MSEYQDSGLTIQQDCELKDLLYESVRCWIGEHGGKSSLRARKNMRKNKRNAAFIDFGKIRIIIRDKITTYQEV